jgi:hypothetical protein
MIEPENIAVLIEGLKAPKGTARYGCEKALRAVSQERPDLIYPFFEVYVDLLDSDNSFIKWGAILTLANLIKADTQKKFDRIFEKYYQPVTGDVMITASNTIGSSVKIISARPDMACRIAGEILKVEKAEYKMHGVLSPECRNVAIGHAVETFDEIFDLLDDKDIKVKIVKFVKRQLKNTRNAVVKKAEKFLKRHKKSA